VRGSARGAPWASSDDDEVITVRVIATARMPLEYNSRIFI
jgi:hypothetical protein